VRQSLQLSLFSEGQLTEAQRLYLYTFRVTDLSDPAAR
jgi:hypothetical protein